MSIQGASLAENLVQLVGKLELAWVWNSGLIRYYLISGLAGRSSYGRPTLLWLTHDDTTWVF